MYTNKARFIKERKDMSSVLDQLKENYIFAVIRGKSSDDAIEISKHSVLGGIKNIEVTYTTPEASKAITELKALYAKKSEVVIGAGTIMTVELAKEAIAAGAEFLVSPHYDAHIQKVAHEAHIDYFPGCATTTELVQAMNGGAKIIKLFPGGVLGPSFIKDIHGPIPSVNLMPSGGVSLGNIKEWKEKGAVAVGVGSALGAKVATEGYESVTRIAKEFVNALAD